MEVMRDDGKELVFYLVESLKLLAPRFHFLLMFQQQGIDLSPALTAAINRCEENDAERHDYDQNVPDKFLFLDCVVLEVAFLIEGGDFRVFVFSFKPDLIAQ